MNDDFYGWLVRGVELLELQAMLLLWVKKKWKHFAQTGCKRNNKQKNN